MLMFGGSPHSRRFSLPARAEGFCGCSTASVCQCPRRWAWTLGGEVKERRVRSPRGRSPRRSHRPGAAACWSSAGFWPAPLRSPSRSYTETSCGSHGSMFKKVRSRRRTPPPRRAHRPFHLRELHHVPDGAGLAHDVEPPQARVGVAGVEGLEAVAQVPLTRHLSQLTGQVLQQHATNEPNQHIDLTNPI